MENALKEAKNEVRNMAVNAAVMENLVAVKGHLSGRESLLGISHTDVNKNKASDWLPCHHFS